MNAKAKLMVLTLAGVLSLGLAAAKHGADDPVGDDRGGHRAGQALTPGRAGGPVTARRGGDDAPGDDHGHHGAGHP